jgi:hypothetical protein
LIAQFNRILAADRERIAALKRKYGIPDGSSNDAAPPDSGLRQ